MKEGDIVSIMTSKDNAEIMEGGRAVVEKAMIHTSPSEVAGALVFECVGTQLNLAEKFLDQVDQTISAALLNRSWVVSVMVNWHEDDFSDQGCVLSLACLLPR